MPGYPPTSKRWICSLGRPSIPDFLYQKDKVLRGQGLSLRNIENQLGPTKEPAEKDLKNEVSQNEGRIFLCFCFLLY